MMPVLAPLRLGLVTLFVAALAGAGCGGDDRTHAHSASAETADAARHAPRHTTEDVERRQPHQRAPRRPGEARHPSNRDRSGTDRQATSQADKSATAVPAKGAETSADESIKDGDGQPESHVSGPSKADARIKRGGSEPVTPSGPSEADEQIKAGSRATPP
jgi:hypothetical protein